MVKTEALKQWAVTVIFSAVAGAVIQLLMPKGKTESAVKIILSLFFLGALLSPFLTGELDFKSADINDKLIFPKTEFSNGEEKLNETILNQMQNETELFICEAARKAGIEEIKAEVCMDISESGGIFINEIKISVPVKERNRALEFADEAEKKFGVKPILDLF